MKIILNIIIGFIIALAINLAGTHTLPAQAEGEEESIVTLEPATPFDPEQ